MPDAARGVLPDLLAGALRTDPARALLTFTDDATGERTELSVATFANWVAKTANLLRDDVAPEPGALVGMDLPLHWQAAVWLQACWAAGHPVALGAAARAGDADVLVVSHDVAEGPADAVPAGVEIVSLGLGPLGLPRPGAVPAYDSALDYDREVHAHADRFVAAPVVGPDDTALVTVEGTATHAELVALARADDAAATLLVADPLTSQVAVLGALLVPLAGGGRAVLCRHLDPERLGSRIAQERVTTLVATGGTGAQTARQQPVTGVLPDWNGPGTGMA